MAGTRAAGAEQGSLRQQECDEAMANPLANAGHSRGHQPQPRSIGELKFKVRDTYRSMVAAEVIDGYDVREGVQFQTPLNKAVTTALVTNIQPVFSEFSHKDIEGSCEGYWQVLCYRARDVRMGKLKIIKDKKSLLCQRRRKKQERRIRGLELVNWDEARKDAVREVLVRDYTSDEEYDDGGCWRYRLIKPLSWESAELTRAKAELDRLEKKESLKKKGVRMECKRLETADPIRTTPPPGAPAWTVRVNAEP